MLKIDLRGHLAIITGASGMLGRVMAKTFADCGADLVLHYFHNQQEAEALAVQLRRQTGRRVIAVQADITSAEDVRRMKEEIIAAKIGTPDLLVHNAVIQYEQMPLIEQPLEDFDSQYQSCVMQTVHMTKTFVPDMIAKGGGRIVVINTECAALCEPGWSAYSAAKRGLDGLVRVLAKELGPHNITINEVAPGWTITEKDRQMHTEVQPDYDSTVPLKRRGTDQEIAQMCAFLASPLASFTTGAYIPVSGGRVMPGI